MVEFKPGQTCRTCGKKLLSRRNEEGKRIFVAPGNGVFCSMKCGNHFGLKMAPFLDAVEQTITVGDAMQILEIINRKGKE